MVNMTIDMLQSLASVQQSDLSYHWSYEKKEKATGPNQTFLEDKRYTTLFVSLFYSMILYVLKVYLITEYIHETCYLVSL